MNKSLLIPIVALLALLIKLIFGYELATEAQDTIVNGVLGIVGLIGAFMHPRKVEKDPSQ